MAGVRPYLAANPAPMPIHRDACPACGSEDVSEVLECTDYTVSRETFPVWHCATCALRFTQNAPEASEIGRYYRSEDYVSHSNSSTGLVNGLYQRVRTVTLKQKLSLVRELTGKFVGGSALDIGCGTGEFLNTLYRAGWQTQGLEPDAGARAYATKHYGLDVDEPGLLFAEDRERNLANSEWDIVTLWHVLEHVHELHAYLARLRRLIGHRGVLLIAVPNYTSRDARHYGAEWAAYDVPRHLYHFSPAAMSRLLGEHDLEVRELRPMDFDPFYVSRLSERYAHGATRPFQAAAAGLRSWWSGRADASSASSIIYICGAA